MGDAVTSEGAARRRARETGSGSVLRAAGVRPRPAAGDGGAQIRALGHVVRLVGEAVTHLRTPRSDTWERTRLRVSRQPGRSAGLPARPLLRGRGRGDRIRVEDL